MNSCGINDNGVQVIVQAATRRSSNSTTTTTTTTTTSDGLVSLEMSGNNIGPTGMGWLASATTVFNQDVISLTHGSKRVSNNTSSTPKKEDKEIFDPYEGFRDYDDDNDDDDIIEVIEEEKHDSNYNNDSNSDDDDDDDGDASKKNKSFFKRLMGK